jgi:hypothetical protein
LSAARNVILRKSIFVLSRGAPPCAGSGKLAKNPPSQARSAPPISSLDGWRRIGHNEPDAAGAFAAFLTRPAAGALMKKNGMAPGSRP